MLSPHGRIFPMITEDDRTTPVTESEQAHAYLNMVYYSGPYRVDPHNKLVTTLDISWHAPWIGTEQVRYCEFHGDQLVLTIAPLAMPATDGETRQMFAMVEWIGKPEPLQIASSQCV